MNSENIFIKLYLDEDVDFLIANLLRFRSFSAITTREADNLGQSDQEQLASAADERRTLLTHNRADFEALAREYYDAGRTHSGIVVSSSL